VRNWNLDERELDHLLEFNLRQLRIADNGRLTLGTSGRTLSVSQRLALHRLLGRAEQLARSP
jgi:hypothetical protein